MQLLKYVFTAIHRQVTSVPTKSCFIADTKEANVACQESCFSFSNKIFEKQKSLGLFRTPHPQSDKIAMNVLTYM